MAENTSDNLAMNTADIDKHMIRSQKSSTDHKPVIRVMTYNIHSCVDRHRNVNPDMIATIIQEQNADIIALQEVDAQKPFGIKENQAGILAKKLNMNFVYFPAETSGLRAFGLAILSPYPIEQRYHDTLPSLYPRLKPRKRAAIRVGIPTPAGTVHIINAHLSLFKLERRRQLKALLGRDWLAALPSDEPVVICGDFNAGPLSGTYRSLSRFLTDVQKDESRSPADITQATFHAQSPLFRIDHIFISRPLQTLRVEVKKTSSTRQASDHLPLIADLACQHG